MTSLEDIREGKSDYFKLEDCDGKEMIFVEPIDIKGQLRSHKVEGKGEGKKKDAEYFDFMIQVEGITKDVGLTYTGLKQLVAVVPTDLKTWEGMRIEYNGTTGSGKNIKYKWKYLGIAAKGTYAARQTTIPSDAPPKNNDEQIVKMKKLKEELIRTSKLWPDGVIPEAGVKAEIQRLYAPGEQTEEMFRLLKFEGWLVYNGNGLKVIP